MASSPSSGSVDIQHGRLRFVPAEVSRGPMRLLRRVGGRRGSGDAVGPPREPVVVPPTLVAAIRDLQADGRNVEAVELVREQFGVGPVDAKAIADAARVHPI